MSTKPNRKERRAAINAQVDDELAKFKTEPGAWNFSEADARKVASCRANTPGAKAEDRKFRELLGL